MQDLLGIAFVIHAFLSCPVFDVPTLFVIVKIHVILWFSMGKTLLTQVLRDIKCMIWVNVMLLFGNISLLCFVVMDICVLLYYYFELLIFSTKFYLLIMNCS